MIGISRTNCQYPSKRKDDTALQDALNHLTTKQAAIGYWQCYYHLWDKGYSWNHEKFYRVYTDMKLNIRRRAKKRLPARVQQPLNVPAQPNLAWSVYFMSDSLTDGRKFRLFNVMDDFSRESLAIEVDTSLTARRIIRVLNCIVEQRGKPEHIRSDNGHEFISQHLQTLGEENQIEMKYIQPGKPTQKAFIERKNGSIRRELLDAYLFDSITEVRHLSEEWR